MNLVSLCGCYFVLGGLLVDSLLAVVGNGLGVVGLRLFVGRLSVFREGIEWFLGDWGFCGWIGLFFSIGVL